MFLWGIDIITRGKIWNVYFQEDRYYVGGILFLFGFYVVILIIKDIVEKGREEK